MAARQGGVLVPALSTAVGVGRVEDGADEMGALKRQLTGDSDNGRRRPPSGGTDNA